MYWYQTSLLLSIFMSVFICGQNISPAHAKPLSPQRSGQNIHELKLPELLQSTRANHPALKGAYLKWQASQVKVPLALALPDPQVASGLKNVGFDRFSVGKEMMSGVALMANQKLPFPSKLSIAKNLAHNQSGILELKYLAQTQAILTQIKLNYFQLYYIQEALKVNQEIKHLLHTFLKTIELKYAVGKVTQQDVLRAHLELSKIKEERIQLLGQQGQLGIKLSRLTGLSISTFKQHLNLPSWRILPESSYLKKLSKKSPLLKTENMLLKQTELKIDLAKSAYYPDFKISGAYVHRGDLSPIWEFKWGSSLPIYTTQKQNLQLKIAQINKENQIFNTLDKTQSLANKIKGLYIKSLTAKRLIGFYQQELIPQAKASFDASLAGYLGSRVDFLMVLNNLQSLFRYKLTLYRQQKNAYQALSQIQNIVAEDLSVLRLKGL